MDWIVIFGIMFAITVKRRHWDMMALFAIALCAAGIRLALLVGVTI